MVDVDAIVRSVAPVVAALGLELYDVELTGSGRARVAAGARRPRRAASTSTAIAAATEADLARCSTRRRSTRALPGPTRSR